MRDISTPVISIEDVIDAVAQWCHIYPDDTHEIVYDFASELTGLSTDAINEKIGEIK